MGRIIARTVLLTVNIVLLILDYILDRENDFKLQLLWAFWSLVFLIINIYTYGN